MTTVATTQNANPLPLELGEIDSDWLTRALRTRAPGVTVRSFEIADIIHGTCTKVRLRLEMDEAGQRAGIPPTVIIKGGFEEHSAAINFVLMTEAQGYRDLLQSSGLNNPECYFADWDEARGQGIIIMEDLARRSVEFGNPMRPRSRDDIAATLSLLANYHARTWGFPDIQNAVDLSWIETAPPFSRAGLQPYLTPESWQKYIGLPRGAAVSTRFHDREWAIGALAAMAKISETVPNCIIHGDSHLGNVFFTPEGSAGFYDIVPRRAPAMSEVCYHVTLALDVADRPVWERELVRHYLDELRRSGVQDVPDFDDAMRQYGAFLVEGYCLVLLNDPYFMPEAPTTAYSARFSAAMLHHDTAGLLAAMAV